MIAMTLIFCILLMIVGTHAAGTDAVDYHALEALWDSTDGPHWKRKFNSSGIPWDFKFSSDPCLDSWEGVQCAAPCNQSSPEPCHVIGLELPRYGLDGTLPTAVCSMSSLTKLFLPKNILKKTLPDCYLQHQTLQTLNLFHNFLSGTLPPPAPGPSLVGTNLTTLVLAENRLSGSIPANFGLQFPRLVYFNATVNAISGSVPPSLFANMPLLEKLDLSLNFLHGTLSEQMWANSTYLQVLDLSGNTLNGSLAKSGICKAGGGGGMTVPSLVTLLLNSNMFTGSLPPCLFNTSTLETLRIDSNFFNGSLPHSPEGWNLPSMGSLVLKYNELTGTIPPFISNLTSLTGFSVSYNMISGTFPVEITQLSKLIIIGVDNNALMGTLPDSLFMMPSLKFFHGTNNSFWGSVFPMAVGGSTEAVMNISKLSSLLLSGNSFSGSLPVIFSMLTTLRSCELSNNRLTGTIPINLLGTVPWEHIFLQSNYFMGPLIVPNNTKVIHLGAFDVANNFLTGTIPATLFDVRKLKYLSLSGNCFHGYFPHIEPNRSSLIQLNMDVLSSNTACRKNVAYGLANVLPYFFGDDPSYRPFLPSRSMEGFMPRKLFKHLPLLAIFFVAGNAFTGTVPNLYERNVNHSLLKQFNGNMNRFTGTLPSAFQVDGVLGTLNLANNRISGTITGMNNIFNRKLYSQHNSLNLKANRLSGPPPEAYEDLTVTSGQSMDILDGNLFQCGIFFHSAPKSDPGSNDAMNCDSNAMYVSLTIVGILSMILIVLWKLFREVRGSGEERLMPSTDASASAEGNVAMVNSANSQLVKGIGEDAAVGKQVDSSMSLKSQTVRLYNEVFAIMTNRHKISVPKIGGHVEMKSLRPRSLARQSSFDDRQVHAGDELSSTQLFITLVGALRLMFFAVMLFATVVCAPTYVALKYVNGGEYSTHEYQYGWVISALFLEGTVPSYWMLSQWLLLCVGVVLTGRYVREQAMSVMEHSSDRARTGAEANFIILFYRLLQLVINITVMVYLNIFYVVSMETATFGQSVLILFTYLFLNVVWKGSLLSWFTDFSVVIRLISLRRILAERYQSSDNEERLSGIRDWERQWVAFLKLGSRLRSTEWFLLSINVINSFVIPFFVVSVKSSQCLEPLVNAPESLTVAGTIQVCTPPADRDAKLDEITKNSTETITLITDVSSHICDYYFSDSTLTTVQNFNLPFVYNKQCVAQIMQFYIPVYLTKYFAVGVLWPVATLVLTWYLALYCKTKEERSGAKAPGGLDGGSRRPTSTNGIAEGRERPTSLRSLPGSNVLVSGYGRIMEMSDKYFWIMEFVLEAIPLRFWPINYTLVRYRTLFADSIDFSGSRSMMYNIFSAFLILVTFGMYFFPLAILLFIYVLVVTTQHQYLIQHHINKCCENEKNFKALTEKLENDCAGLWKLFPRYCSLLLVISSVFVVLYLHDTAPDNSYIPAIAILVPLAYHICKRLWSWAHPKSYERFSRRSTTSIVSLARRSSAGLRSIRMHGSFIRRSSNFSSPIDAGSNCSGKPPFGVQGANEIYPSDRSKVLQEEGMVHSMSTNPMRDAAGEEHNQEEDRCSSSDPVRQETGDQENNGSSPSVDPEK